jgi:hypothetical protein
MYRMVHEWSSKGDLASFVGQCWRADVILPRASRPGGRADERNGFGCPSCGTKPRENARFCDGCGTQITAPVGSAEYKQVTVLFADVVHSMELAATLDPSGCATSCPRCSTGRHW